MGDPYFLSFNHPIDPSLIPKQLNNPFSLTVPPICNFATQELQSYLEENQKNWIQNFGLTANKEGKARGKMFGILIVQNTKGELGYLQTFSGTLKTEFKNHLFVPSIFDDSTDDFYINKGMAELTSISKKITQLDDPVKIDILKKNRASKSTLLQKWLFNQYRLLNKNNEVRTVLEVFNKLNKNPPAAAGECAAPKLLHHAFANNYKPLAITEFWWGTSPKSAQRIHKGHYPACENKCRPILTFMLDKVFPI